MPLLLYSLVNVTTYPPPLICFLFLPFADGCKERGVSSLEDKSIRGEMSVSSVETICSYSSGGSRLGAAGEVNEAGETGEAKETHLTKGEEETSETIQSDVTNIAGTTKRVDVRAQPKELRRAFTPDDSTHTQKAALSCALGRISSNYVMHASNNTSVVGEWSRKLSTSNTVNLCKVTKFINLCDEELSVSSPYIRNDTKGAKTVEEMPQESVTHLRNCKLESHQVGVSQAEGSFENAPQHINDKDRHSNDRDRYSHDSDRYSNDKDRYRNSSKVNRQSEASEDPCYDHPCWNKRVFIRRIEGNCHTNGRNTFTYLNDVLDKTYKETVELDGSEYIFLYDIICVEDADVASQLDRKGESTLNRSCSAFAGNCRIPLEEENHVLKFSAYNKYVNFFHNLSNQMNRIKRLIYPIEVDMSTGYTSRGSLTIAGETSMGGAHNNTETKRRDGPQPQIAGCRMVGGLDERNLESIQSLFAEEEHLKGSLKMKLLERLNCIFFTAMGSIGKEVNSTVDENCVKCPVNSDDDTTSKNPSNLHVNCPPRKNQLTPLDMNKITQHMKASANRRIHESDIYDINILKKGYFYLYVQNGHWEHYYCALFHIKNNVLFKNDLLYTHYCKIYDRGILHNVLNSPDSYTNYFMAFFKDHHFDMNRMSDLELAIMIRKNYYPFVIELSLSKKANITIHTSPDVLLHAEHTQPQRVRSSLTLFDITSDPFYLIPIEFLQEDGVTTISGGTRMIKGLANEPSQGNIPSHARVKLHYGLLKEWNDSLDCVMEKAKQKRTSLCDKGGQSEKTHYVNKKFSQWIEAFKKERNIKEGAAYQYK
eukprot:XP_002261536.1 hypothetical protein, conserved in Plasmodium species [Plasmodium knowlesi strain H]